MPVSAVSSITRAATRRDDEPLNILTLPTHERYETGLAQTGHNFYAYHAPGIKTWKRVYAPVPPNYYLLDAKLESRQIPLHVDFDLVLSQNKFGQYQIAEQISRQLRLPLVSLEHTLPVPTWDVKMRQAMVQLQGDLNVFISDYSIKEWGFDPDDESVLVVRHGVDTGLFTPKAIERKNHILSVVNDWINRDWCCGFQKWRRITQKLPVAVLGDTPGLSQPAASTEALVTAYNASRIFLNTSVISPVPTALMEAMAMGCAVVTTATCMIPEIVQDGVNGFISNDEAVLRSRCEQLLNDESLAKRLGEAARQTIVERYNLDRFVADWNHVLRKAADLV